MKRVPILTNFKRPIYQTIFISTTTNFPHIYYINIASYKTYKDIVITKPDKRNGVVILDGKLYNNASKFEKLNEDPTLK